MKKNPASETIVELNKSVSSWEDNPAIEWLAKHGRNILIGLLALIAISLIIYRLSMLGTERSEMNYWNANKEFGLFAKPIDLGSDPLDNTEALSNLSKILDKQPELHSKYDGLIAQILINRNDAANAEPFANSAISRTQIENSPFYTEYAQTTLLMAQSKFQEALNKSLSLNTQMQDAIQKNASVNERHFGDALFAFNVLRIGILQQQLGLKSDELKTWQDWKQYILGKKSPEITKAFQQIQSHLAEGKISISDYIDSRIVSLKTK